MRRRHTKNQDGTLEIDLTSMIDMIFILLIFFIVTSSFVKETGIEIKRPGAHSAEPKTEANILIAISEGGEIWIDRHQVQMDAISAHVERLHAENPEGGVVILADENSNTGLVVQVVDRAKRAGVSSVSIAAEKGL